jgi:hypothetical protein
MIVVVGWMIAPFGERSTTAVWTGCCRFAASAGATELAKLAAITATKAPGAQQHCDKALSG